GRPVRQGGVIVVVAGGIAAGAGHAQRVAPGIALDPALASAGAGPLQQPAGIRVTQMAFLAAIGIADGLQFTAGIEVVAQGALQRVLDGTQQPGGVVFILDEAVIGPLVGAPALVRSAAGEGV